MAPRVPGSHLRIWEDPGSIHRQGQLGGRPVGVRAALPCRQQPEVVPSHCTPAAQFPAPPRLPPTTSASRLSVMLCPELGCLSLPLGRPCPGHPSQLSAAPCWRANQPGVSGGRPLLWPALPTAFSALPCPAWASGLAGVDLIKDSLRAIGRGRGSPEERGGKVPPAGPQRPLPPITLLSSGLESSLGSGSTVSGLAAEGWGQRLPLLAVSAPSSAGSRCTTRCSCDGEIAPFTQVHLRELDLPA